MHIPKHIHQIWFQGEEKIPKHLLEYHNSWKTTCNDYRITVWDEKSIKELLNNVPAWIQDTYNSYEKMIQKIDFAKYVILYYHGGIYIDMDVKCLKSLNDTPGIATSKVIFSKMPYNTCQKLLFVLLGQDFKDDILNNGIIFAEPRNDILLQTLKEACKNKHSVFKHVNNMLHVFLTTGPVCLTNAYAKQKNRQGVTILDNTYFEACDINDVHKECKLPVNAIGLHVYEGSWVSESENIAVNTYFYMYENMNVILILMILIFFAIKYV